MPKAGDPKVLHSVEPAPMQAAAKELAKVADSQFPTKDHPAEYRTFIREVRNRDKFPVGLASSFRQNKVDLFHLWRKNGKDWSAVQMIVKRRASKITESLGKKTLVKVRTLVKEGMPLAKAVQLKERKKAAGMGQYDPEFPDDNDEYMFWVTSEVSRSNYNRTEESMEAEGKKELDDAEAEDLLGDDGILAAGINVAGPGVSDKNAAAFAESMTNLLANDSTGQTKLAKIPKTVPQTEPAEMTPKSIALAKCEEMMKEMKEAHQFNLVLSSNDLDKETASGMKKHAEYMCDKYKLLTALVQSQSEPEEYVPLMTEIETKQNWFELKAPIAKRLCSAARQGGQPGKRQKATK